MRTGCKIETIRYYERIGLLPAVPRTEGGHRIYRDDHARRLAFIRRARELGFSLDQVRELLAWADEDDPVCEEVQAIAARHRDRIRAKIADLRSLERALSKAIAQCETGVAPECPVLTALLPARR
jgi:MerR family mercuric resistance operon transcriptional regulator